MSLGCHFQQQLVFLYWNITIKSKKTHQMPCYMHYDHTYSIPICMLLLTSLPSSVKNSIRRWHFNWSSMFLVVVLLLLSFCEINFFDGCREPLMSLMLRTISAVSRAFFDEHRSICPFKPFGCFDGIKSNRHKNSFWSSNLVLVLDSLHILVKRNALCTCLICSSLICCTCSLSRRLFDRNVRIVQLILLCQSKNRCNTSDNETKNNFVVCIETLVKWFRLTHSLLKIFG